MRAMPCIRAYDIDAQLQLNATQLQPGAPWCNRAGAVHFSLGTVRPGCGLASAAVAVAMVLCYDSYPGAISIIVVHVKVPLLTEIPSSLSQPHFDLRGP